MRLEVNACSLRHAAKAMLHHIAPAGNVRLPVKGHAMLFLPQLTCRTAGRKLCTAWQQQTIAHTSFCACKTGQGAITDSLQRRTNADPAH